MSDYCFTSLIYITKKRVDHLPEPLGKPSNALAACLGDERGQVRVVHHCWNLLTTYFSHAQ